MTERGKAATGDGDRRRGGVWTLAAVNAVLGLAVAAAWLSPGWWTSEATAQPDGDRERARGVYTLVGGDVVGSASNVAYIVDSVNAEIIAVRVEGSRRVDLVDHRDIARDATAPERRRRR